ncbi:MULTISPECIES: DUF2946 family protein [Rhodobacterales]|jgi:hypothetical protein|uniref:DUF2946 family protein n=1 Tax=Rhodobacterales TaxID=204455 RepID=UPI00237F1025|nr:DUF2946 family protein [Phaeobacter gallaeciensis]MDE4142714.1 hypothetical protein [Phaeobacter gallaeciensis]MDE4151159.1 hypothetical protein [Phaeobacter gallaeciensis]MDE4155345.1 hypothetical protein [Phaeobacter gallaeciensis]MDE4230736.1 hypothetical protein [Phaeobacter gallaeciensis]MDE4259856.1 hypothetical protein [Phaeobacter gallaeciensis]
MDHFGPCSLFFLSLITRALLLLALLGSSTVPDGLMRAQGPEGMRLVLCTPDGTQEVWLTDAGEIIPAEDDQPARDDHGGPHCVQVSVAGTVPSANVGLLIQMPLRPLALPTGSAQRPVSLDLPNQHRSRAPPLPV